MSTQKRDIRQLATPIFLGFLLLLIANAVFYFLMTRPQVESYTQLSTNTGPQAMALKAKERFAERLEAYVEGLEKAETDMGQLREEVLSTADKRMIEIQALVEELCEKFNVPLRRVAYFDDTLVAEELFQFGMTVPLEGNYADLRRFLQAVESSDTFVVVESVALGAANSQSAGLLLNITLSTYFNATPQQLQAARAPGRG